MGSEHSALRVFYVSPAIQFKDVVWRLPLITQVIRFHQSNLIACSALVQPRIPTAYIEFASWRRPLNPIKAGFIFPLRPVFPVLPSPLVMHAFSLTSLYLSVPSAVCFDRRRFTCLAHLPDTNLAPSLFLCASALFNPFHTSFCSAFFSRSPVSCSTAVPVYTNHSLFPRLYAYKNLPTRTASLTDLDQKPLRFDRFPFH
jgi:hypothetical protein